MRMLILLAGLVVTAGGCGGPAQQTRTAPLPLPAPRLDPGGRVDADSYERHREFYDALPLDHPGRAILRARLMRHLLAQAGRELDSGQPEDAIDYFVAACTLYEPTEIYRGGLRQDDLLALASRLKQVYSRLGDERRALLTLGVELSLTRKTRPLLAEYRSIVSWVDENSVRRHGPIVRGRRVAEFLEQAGRVWPSRFLTDELRRLYMQQLEVLQAEGERMNAMGTRASFPAQLLLSFNIARAYVRVGRPDEALRHLQALPERHRNDRMVRLMLRRVSSAKGKVQDYLNLAMLFGSRRRNDQDVGLTICRAARRRFPLQAGVHKCMGQQASLLGRDLLAVLSLERAVELAPAERVSREMLASVYQQYLQGMAASRRLQEASALLRKLEQFYAESERQTGAPLELSLAGVYRSMGQAYFGAGDIDRAVAAYRKALAADRIPSEALAQLVTIQMNRGDLTGAMRELEQAQRSLRGLDSRDINPVTRDFWLARLEYLRAQALERLGRADESRRAHRELVPIWRQLRAQRQQQDFHVETLVYEAKSLFAVGQPARGMDALDKAIDAMPGRFETYFDAVALLTTYGHLPEALDAYHRALGRREITDYHKSYCSFWVIGLARRAKTDPDPQALEHLRRLRGREWYTRLAQFVLGKVTFQQLMKEADSAGNRAELFYYWADLLVAQGKLEQARQMWKQVIDTNMMGFYEYEMSRYNLRHGPAKVYTRIQDRIRE